MADFITTNLVSVPGPISYISRSMVLVTREAVIGFTPDPTSGLIKINKSDLSSFKTQNPTSYGLSRNLDILFGQSRTKDYVYILSKPAGVASTDLDAAYEDDKRAWTFISFVERYQYGGTGSDATSKANYVLDFDVIAAWLSASKAKILIHTLSLEDIADLPPTFETGGLHGLNEWIKTLVSDSQIDLSGNLVYNNILMAVYGFCVSDSRPARSWGSFSDAHDFSVVGADSYSLTDHSSYLDNNLSLYNGAKDRAKSLFMYDTFMNGRPDDLQIETRLAMIDIEDAGYVDVRNALQAAGVRGVPSDNSGIQTVGGILENSLDNSYARGLILSKGDGTPDYTLKVLTADEVTALDPAWQSTGVWPGGVFEATIKPFGATHYITLTFIFA